MKQSSRPNYKSVANKNALSARLRSAVNSSAMSAWSPP